MDRKRKNRKTKAGSKVDKKPKSAEPGTAPGMDGTDQSSNDYGGMDFSNFRRNLGCG